MQNKFKTAEEVKDYISLALKDDKNSSSYYITEVVIETEKDIDGKKVWKYRLEGLPVPRTRNEYWMREDGKSYSIFGCLEHSIEQVIREEVPGPNHTNENH